MSLSDSDGGLMIDVIYAMTLASDFVDASGSYVSTTKTIRFSIDSKEKLESILFGCTKYYK